MTDKKDEQLTKRVDFVAKDDDEQIATGIVMVPDKVDLQFDFAREDTIRGFADQFGDFMEVGQADGGLMHAVWPSDWMELERNEVLDEATEIGGKEAPAGAWIQSWKFNDDDLWQLVKDDILGAFSIGAIAVQWGGPYEQEELEDVDVPDEIDEEELVWELAGGTIREVSSVDIPAVPDAQVLETKAEAEKRLADHLGNRDGFVEEALERNPDWSEDDADQLWETLNSAIDVEGSGEPGKQSFFERIGKAAFNAFPGAGSDDDTPTKTSEAPDHGRGAEKDADDFEADVFRVTAPEDEAENYEDEVLGIGVDFPKSDVYVDWRNEVFPDQLDEPHVSIYGSVSDLEQATGNTVEQMDTLNAKAAKTMFGASGLQVNPIAKEGRTLSTRNRDNLFAAIDASADVLEDAGVDHGITRFTDREDTSFDLSEHTARDWPDPDEDEEEDSAGTDGPPFESAAGGETPDDTDSTDMTNDDNPMADAPEWAKALNDRIDDLVSEEKDAGAGDAPMADAPEWAKNLDERINEIEEKALDDDGEDKPEWAKSLEARIDAISKQTGTDSQQIGKVVSEESEKGGGFTLDPRKARGN